MEIEKARRNFFKGATFSTALGIATITGANLYEDNNLRPQINQAEEDAHRITPSVSGINFALSIRQKYLSELSKYGRNSNSNDLYLTFEPEQVAEKSLRQEVLVAKQLIEAQKKFVETAENFKNERGLNTEYFKIRGIKIAGLITGFLGLVGIALSGTYMLIEANKRRIETDAQVEVQKSTI